MRATASWWNQGELGCFTTRRAVPRDVPFTDVVWVWFIRTGFWLFATTVLLILSWKCLPIVSSLARSPFAYTYVQHWCSMCPSALVHGLHISIWDREPLPRSPSRWFSALLQLSSLCRSIHPTCSILRSIFRWQVWSILFSFSVKDHVWAPYNGTGNTQDSRTSFFVSVFGICRAV
jgi:hypothetical protein